MSDFTKYHYEKGAADAAQVYVAPKKSSKSPDLKVGWKERHVAPAKLSKR